MKIIGLTAENVKRILAVRIEIDPETNMLVIGGENGAGKSSVLDSVAMALGGKDAIPDQPVRQGASKARVILETDEITVTRTWNANGTQLVVTAKDGAKQASPQALLDSLTNTTCLDPLAFTRLDAKKQGETLRRLVGLDFEALDKERDAKYGERTIIGREVKTQEARVNGMQRHPGAPKELATVDEIAFRLKAASEKNDTNAAMRSELPKYDSDVIGAEENVEALKLAVRNAEEELARVKSELTNWTEDVTVCKGKREEFQKQIDALADVDTAPILEEMKTLEATNQKVRENKAWQEENDKLVTLTRKTAALTERLAGIDEEKETALSKAKFPVPGLSFTSDGVTFNGVPFDQSSSAEQLRVSVAMGFALQPSLKLALIRDGSLLDTNSLRLIAELAEQHGATVLVERVGDGAECQVIMSDGEVSEVREQKPRKSKPAAQQPA